MISHNREDYLELQAKSGLKRGDKVKIVRKATNYEKGWQNSWTMDMNECVGKVFTIDSDALSSSSSGIHLKETEYGWPVFVLEKVSKTKLEAVIEKFAKRADAERADLVRNLLKALKMPIK